MVNNINKVQRISKKKKPSEMGGFNLFLLNVYTIYLASLFISV